MRNFIIYKELMAERAGFEPAWGGKAPSRFRVGAGMATSVPLPGLGNGLSAK